jgi:hypothetical protein
MADFAHNWAAALLLTQEFIWTHLIEDLLHSATVIVASSRPVISCTGMLHLSADGLKGFTQVVAGFL